jgi:hypothetical protein
MSEIIKDINKLMVELQDIKNSVYSNENLFKGLTLDYKLIEKFDYLKEQSELYNKLRKYPIQFNIQALYTNPSTNKLMDIRVKTGERDSENFILFFNELNETLKNYINLIIKQMLYGEENKKWEYLNNKK